MLKWFRSSRKPNPDKPRKELEDYGGDPALIHQALTHKSVEGEPDNERLEFLGDAVLELVISEHLYKNYPNYSEGKLTKARVVAVSEPTLADAARHLKLTEKVKMARGEEASGGRDRPSILSDAFEAVVAAIYLSAGMEAAREFVLDQIGHTMDVLVERDFKSRLQERTQEAMKATPSYKIVKETGPPHDKIFVAQVSVSGKVLATGEGRSKKIAEQAAAETALEEMTRPCP